MSDNPHFITASYSTKKSEENVTNSITYFHSNRFLMLLCYHWNMMS